MNQHIHPELSDESPDPNFIDFNSDEPLPVCPTRNNGDDTCESCQ
ncbi:hypothetical protein [Caldimonas thermodepolymerans]|nr:hypothetical protein [Caldimonas thermodepolymerans]RDI02928.1 hypothetical protein DES46_102356 [Caldimonas thermodepolymerans]